jgi:SAM-dependent methyltransferase
MREHLKEIADDVAYRAKIEKQDVWLDIGCNDATMLNFVDCWTVGFDPSDIVWSDPDTEESDKHVLVRDYFTADKYPLTRKAKVVTMIACFYDLDDPNTFLQDVKKILAPDGLFVIEMNYLPTMLQNNAVDNISHEHLCYYSFLTLGNLLDKNGLWVEDIQFSEINGGVARYYIRHGISQDKEGNDTIWGTAESEWAMKLHTMEPYLAFKDRVNKNMYRLKAFITQETLGTKDGAKFKKQPKQVWALGASTRGSIIVQLADLDRRLIPAVIERDPTKMGKTYVGGIQIVGEDEIVNQPDYKLVLPYFYSKEVIEREKNYLMTGGKLIIPMPNPYIVSYEPI